MLRARQVHPQCPIKETQSLQKISAALHGFFGGMHYLPLRISPCGMREISVERVIAPDATILLDYMLERVKNMYKNLMVYPDRMEKNLSMSQGLHHSESILLSLIKKGLTRQEAYKLTQSVAMKCYDHGLDFRTELKRDQSIAQFLQESEIDDITTNEHYFKYVDSIFARVFIKKPL